MRDYVVRIWNNSADDNIFFLASGVAFSLLLAAVPFVLLAVSTLAYVLHQSPEISGAAVRGIVDQLLPPHSELENAPIHQLLTDVLKVRTALSVWSAVGLVWFMARLFGSLRSALADVFDIETERGILAGKWFDLRLTAVTIVFTVVYVALNAYLAIATIGGVRALAGAGIRLDVLSRLQVFTGRALSMAVLTAMFYSFYKFLPNRRILPRPALLGAVTASVLFEIARQVYTRVTLSFEAGSVYTGTLYALISIVFWVYYAAVIFLIGGEVAQVHEVRRVLRQQRETFAPPSRRPTDAEGGAIP